MGRFGLIFWLCVAMVLMGAGAWLARGAGPAGDAGKSTTLVGELVDTCFITSDGAAHGPDHAKCAAECLRAGLPAGILPEGAQNSDEMLYLLLNPSSLAPYAGKVIKVEGTRLDHKHAFNPRRLWVRDGQGWLEVALAAAPQQGQPASAQAALSAPDVEPSGETWKAPARAARRENPVAGDAQSLAAGKTVYAENCASCHGATGHNDGPLAKDLEKLPPELSSALLWKQTDGALFWKITEGHKPMPTWKSLVSETDRWNVINHIRTMAPRPESPPPANGAPQGPR